MDRCALFVDAGYVLTDGAMSVHGTRRRESVSWDYAGLLQLFSNLAMERARLPLLRCYWYEATVEGRRSADHDTLSDLPGVKVRVAKMRPGRREGVEGEIHRDLTTLARNKAVSDVMLVSAEEDLGQVIAEVQDMGLRVTLLHIAVDGNWTISRALRQECDDIVEISASHLRPYVELISGAEPPRPDDFEGAPLALRPLVAGSVNGNGLNGNGNGAGRGLGYAQQVRPAAGQLPPALSAPAEPVPQPVAMDTVHAELGQPERPAASGPASLAPGLDFGASADYRAAADYPPVVERPSPVPSVDETVSDYGAAFDYGSTGDYGHVRDYPAPVRAPSRDDIYAAPVAVPAPVQVIGPADNLPGERDWQPGRGRLGGDLAAYNPGGVRDQYPHDSGLWEPPSALDGGDRLQPVPVTVPGDSGQVRRLPTRGQQALGLPSAPSEPSIGQQGVPQLGGQTTSGQPTGSQPVLPVAPVVPMDYPGARGAAPGGARQVLSGPGAPGGPVPSGPPAPSLGPGPQPGPPVPPAPPAAGGQQASGGYPGVVPGVSLADAVQSAHEEGQAFGESVARDAPALWLEAVLARKPRMPSDLEARLLQGSALPIDFLLHDEVRHALRRGFWDALERARR